MDVQNNGYLSIEQLTDRYLTGAGNIDSRSIDPRNVNFQKTGIRETAGLSFQKILEQKTAQETDGDLKFSKHALGRLNDRNIELSKGQLERLNDGARKAGQKGIRESLVIVDQLAFIVNVPNRTVVTAMDSTETTENIFTNINGAVII